MFNLCDEWDKVVGVIVFLCNVILDMSYFLELMCIVWWWLYCVWYLWWCD